MSQGVDPKPPLNESQKIVFSLYEQFQQVCEAEGLRYFAISGTTLGAVLWNGIIPWDDDIDITMPVEDYRKFIKIYKKYLPDNICFNEYVWFGGKLHDSNTMATNIYYINQPDKYNGIFLDIVPMIGLPDDQAERDEFIARLFRLKDEGFFREIYDVGDKTISQLKKEARAIQDKYKFDESKYVMDFSDPRYVLSSKGFQSPIKMKFETGTINVSSGYKEDLRVQYGKYKKYPPKEKRSSNHVDFGIVDTRISCRVYADDYRKINPKISKLLDIQRKYNGESILQKFEIVEQLKFQQQTITNLTNELDSHKSIKVSLKLLMKNMKRKIIG